MDLRLCDWKIWMWKRGWSGGPFALTRLVQEGHFELFIDLLPEKPRDRLERR